MSFWLQVWNDEKRVKERFEYGRHQRSELCEDCSVRGCESVGRAKAVWLVASKGASGDARELKSVMARGYSSSNKGV